MGESRTDRRTGWFLSCCPSPSWPWPPAFPSTLHLLLQRLTLTCPLYTTTSTASMTRDTPTLCSRSLRAVTELTQAENTGSTSPTAGSRSSPTPPDLRGTTLLLPTRERLSTQRLLLTSLPLPIRLPLPTSLPLPLHTRQPLPTSLPLPLHTR